MSKGDALVGMFIPYRTGNEESAYCLPNDNSKRWPASAMVMEMLSQAMSAGVQLVPAHVKRDYNTWADSLVNGKSKGLVPDKRLRPDRCPPRWLVLETLLKLGEPEA